MRILSRGGLKVRSRLWRLALVLGLESREVQLLMVSILGVAEFLGRWRGLKPVDLIEALSELCGV